VKVLVTLHDALHEKSHDGMKTLYLAANRNVKNQAAHPRDSAEVASARGHSDGAGIFRRFQQKFIVGN